MKYLLLFLVCLLLCACQNTTTETETVRPTVLTHVYTETPVALPEGYRFDAFVTENEDGLLVDLIRNEKTDEGTFLWYSRWQYDKRGENPTMLWEYPQTEYPMDMWKTEDGEYALWYCSGEVGTAYRLTHTDNDGQTTVIDAPEARLGTANRDGQVYLQEMRVDGEGTVYLFTNDGILLYNRALFFLGVLDDLDVKGWTAQGNTVMVMHRKNGTLRLASVDREGCALSEEYPVPQNAACFFTDSMENLYYHTPAGIFRYTTVETEDGVEAAGEMVLDYGSSNLYNVVARSVRMLDDGRILLAYEEHEDSFVNDMPVIMNPAPDVDLSEITVLELVTSDSDAAARLGKAVVRFNKKHPDARIVWKDYSKYNTHEEPSAGESKLALDMSTGLVQPDIYYGAPWRDGFALILRTENYIDLTPVLENEPVYNPDNLVGAVKTTYTINGKLMAIPLYMVTETALVSPAFFSDADTRTSWTIGEFLTLAKDLPEGAMVRKNLRKENALQALLGMDWPGLFIDQAEGRCDFDGADFVGLLTFIQNLSKNGGDSRESMKEGDNQYIAFQEGRSLMAGSRAVSLTGYVQDKRYGEDRLMIGYPTRDGLSGSVLSTDTELFVLTGTCASPELAWECIREVVTDGDVSDYTMPVWKSMLEEAVAEAMEVYHFLSYEGGTVRDNMPIELSADGTYHGEPGMTTQLTREEADIYIAWLDTVGRPLDRCVIQDEIWAIVNEELSRFYEGAADAVGCAGAIQSRVQLWLDENG